MFRRPLPCLLAVCCLALFARPVCAQSADDVARELQRLRTQIEQERRSISQDSARQSEWRAQTRSRHASMRSETQRLSSERDSLRQALERSTRPKAPVAPPLTPAAARKKAFSEALAKEIELTIPLLAKELDRGAELPDEWSRLAKGLRAGSEDPSEAMGRFLDALSERIDMGSRITSHAGTYTDASGRATRGLFLEMGGILQVFVSRQGDKAAMKRRGESDLRELTNPSEIASLARTVRILSGDSEPGWVYLPVRGVKP